MGSHHDKKGEIQFNIDFKFEFEIKTLLDGHKKIIFYKMEVTVSRDVLYVTCK